MTKSLVDPPLDVFLALLTLPTFLASPLPSPLPYPILYFPFPSGLHGRGDAGREEGPDRAGKANPGAEGRVF